MNMRTNGDRSPDEIQADVERTRSEVHDTLSAIEQRLTPSQLFDQGIDYLRHSGAREYVSNLGESAKQEPIPLALVGIGLAWLMFSNGHGRSSTTTGHVTAEDMAARARQSADSVAEGVRGTISSVRERAARTSHRIGDTAHAARERASQMSAAAHERALQMRHGYERIVNEHPLALGAIGLAVGAVLAATAPRTRQEDRLMGDASDRMKSSVREAGKEQVDHAASSLHAARVEAEQREDLHTGSASASRSSSSDSATSSPGLRH